MVRRRTPEKIKRLQGTYRDDRDHETVKPVPIAGDPPSWLPDDAKEKWAQLAPVMQGYGLLTEIDRDQFAQYCLFYVRAIEAESDIEQRGLLVQSARDSSKVKNPAVSIAKEYHSAASKLADKFGMNPLNRENVSTYTEPQEESVMESLLSGKWEERREKERKKQEEKLNGNIT